nr:hypothetical protein [Glycomyces xiaoerkulensis]
MAAQAAEVLYGDQVGAEVAAPCAEFPVALRGGRDGQLAQRLTGDGVEHGGGMGGFVGVDADD